MSHVAAARFFTILSNLSNLPSELPGRGHGPSAGGEGVHPVMNRAVALTP
jgi:hypothetical protein